MTHYSIEYSFNLEKISSIMKGGKENKAELILDILSRGAIRNEKLKKELLFRLKRCINNNIFNIEKFDLFVNHAFPISPEYVNIDFLEGDDEIVGIKHDKKWSGIAQKELCSDELIGSIFCPYEAESSMDNEASNTLYEQLRDSGCRYYYTTINEMDGNKIREKSIEDFSVQHYDNWLFGLGKIKDFGKFSKSVKESWKRKIKDTPWLHEEDMHRIILPLKLVENALKHGEDTLCEGSV